MPKITAIPLNKTNHFPKIVIDYISGHASLAPFYEHPPTLSSFKKALKTKQDHYTKEKRTQLVQVLQKQYEALETTGTVTANIKSLTKENTFTITTGHQLNIFTGPLYFIYKIISTINLAKKLNEKYKDYHFVPVFWMATEDHDLEEINHIHLFGQTIKWDCESDGKGEVGKLKTASLKKLLKELKAFIGDTPEAQYLNDLFSKAYLQHNNLTDATRYLINELFQKDGLVITGAPAKASEWSPIKRFVIGN